MCSHQQEGSKQLQSTLSCKLSRGPQYIARFQILQFYTLRDQFWCNLGLVCFFIKTVWESVTLCGCLSRWQLPIIACSGVSEVAGPHTTFRCTKIWSSSCWTSCTYIVLRTALSQLCSSRCYWLHTDWNALLLISTFQYVALVARYCIHSSCSKI